MLFFKIIFKKNQYQYTKNKILESKLANSAKKKEVVFNLKNEGIYVSDTITLGQYRSIVLFLFNSTRGGHTPGT